MKRLFYLLIGLVLLPAFLYAQGTLSLKDINDNLTNNYYTKVASDARYPLDADTYDTAEVDAKLADKADTDSVYTKVATDALLADKSDTAPVILLQTEMDSAEAKINDLDIINDSQDVAINNINSDIDSAEVAINLNNIDDDSQDVTIEANKVGVASLEVGLQTHQNNPTGAHAATAISATWTNVQVSLDSLETAIQSIVVGSGFALESWVNSTLETNFYNKTQTNATIEAAIAAIPATDLSNYYTKAQTESTVAVMIKDNAQAKYWYPANMANGDWTGEVIVATVSASQTQYNAVYMKSDGWASAKADAYTTLPAIGIILETGTGSKKVLVKGIIKNTSWSFTQGQRIYVSAATAGAVTSTAPTTTGQLVQIIGIALAADTIYVCPDTTCVEN